MNMDDNAIIELYFNRDEKAIKLTREKYGVYCYTISHNILLNREDAEECVNDTYLKVWNSIPPKRPNVLRLYLAKITRNLSLDRYDERFAEKRGGGETKLALDELSECVSGSYNIEGELMERQLENSIKAFLSRLSELDRTMFLRRYFYLEPHADVAKAFGISAHGLSVKLDRIRKKLRKHLEKEGYFNDRQ